ncbi:MAG: tetratricopeptide repeat protein, partial [Bacteroidales bacterium]|nr:tetratricopeptide repeat protein [Bacteroidales bacterium]
MKSIVTFLLVFLLSNFASAQTKTQNARVKTRGRMIDGEYVPGKGLPGTVVSIKDITDIGVRNSDGTFSFPVDNDNYYVETVTKNEYVLVDSDAAPKMYKYSEDTLYFVMGMPEQMFEDLLEAKDKIRESLEREWKNAMAEIKRLKEENKMSQEEYLEKLEQLMSNQEKNEDLVNEMAKRYSTLDYDQLDVFYRKVNSYIEEGKLTKADSMLRSRGNVSAQIDAQLEKEESIRHREEEIAKAKSVLMHDKKELEQRCYSYFESFKMQHEYDSAAYYIEQRARIDTLNAEWQFGAGVYLYEQKQYSKAEKYLESYLKLSRDLIKSDGSYAVALIVLADLYQNIQRYSDAEQMYEESLEICRKLAKDNPQVYESYVSVALNALAELYIVTQRYSEAEQMYEESLEILRKLAKDNPQVYESYVANALNAFANLYSDTQRYSEAEQMYEESLEI